MRSLILMGPAKKGKTSGALCVSGLNVWIRVKFILRKCNEKIWTRLTWFKTGIGRALVNTLMNLAEQLLAPPEGFTVIGLYYIKKQQDATLAVLFINHCKITLHVSDAFCVHHQEY